MENDPSKTFNVLNPEQVIHSIYEKCCVKIDANTFSNLWKLRELGIPPDATVALINDIAQVEIAGIKSFVMDSEADFTNGETLQVEKVPKTIEEMSSESEVVLQRVVNFRFWAGSGYCNPGSGPGTGIPLNLKPGYRVPSG